MAFKEERPYVSETNVLFMKNGLRKDLHSFLRTMKKAKSDSQEKKTGEQFRFKGCKCYNKGKNKLIQRELSHKEDKVKHQET